MNSPPARHGNRSPDYAAMVDEYETKEHADLAQQEMRARVYPISMFRDEDANSHEVFVPLNFYNNIVQKGRDSGRPVFVKLDSDRGDIITLGNIAPVSSVEDAGNDICLVAGWVLERMQVDVSDEINIIQIPEPERVKLIRLKPNRGEYPDEESTIELVETMIKFWCINLFDVIHTRELDFEVVGLEDARGNPMECGAIYDADVDAEFMESKEHEELREREERQEKLRQERLRREHEEREREEQERLRREQESRPQMARQDSLRNEDPVERRRRLAEARMRALKK
jgi:hypothetical protein